MLTSGASLLLLDRVSSLNLRGAVIFCGPPRTRSLHAAELVDEKPLKLQVVGSADAFNALGRAHSCYLVEGDGLGPLMVDFGATALGALRRLGRSPEELRAVVITHLHGDHFGGLPFLIINAMFNEPRSAPLHIYGPVGLGARLNELLRVVYGGITDRDKPFDLEIHELAPNVSYPITGGVIQTYAASHMDPPEQPLCLRIVTEVGRSVAFSGDTEMCDGLREAAMGADLLVAECSAMTHPCGRHCAWEDWRDALPTIGSKRVLLSHLGAEVRNNVEVLLAEAPPDVALDFADDGLLLTI